VIAIGSDGQTLVSAAETSIKICTSTGKLLQTIQASSIPGILTIAISPDGQTLASTAVDTSVKLWNLRTGTLLKTLVPPVNEGGNLDRFYLSSIAFSRDRKILAIGHGGGAT
jgi:WD40 repeat protein